MKRLFLILGLAFLPSNLLFSQIILKEPLSPRLTGYSIDARLDDESKTVEGVMDAFWVNNSTAAVPDLHMHLYMNAFKSSRTTFNKGYGGRIRASEAGWIDIIEFYGGAGNDLMPFIQYFSPDDGNPYDSTVIRIVLPEPVKPGDTAFVRIKFKTKMPSNIRRTGYTKDFYFIAQWFPKFGVYETTGMRYALTDGWNCHQFHANSEFYSNHSAYDVTITLPEKYVVGSGGLLLSEKRNDDGSKTMLFRAEDIVDFAWTAWPGYSVHKDKWKHVDITLLLPSDRLEQVNRQFAAVKYALEYLTENVGPYPWPHLTFIDPPATGSGAGGMEYTTLFTTISSYRMPEWVRLPEMVTIHEFGHAYFMGILASNEFEEPWLDEGVNSFWEARIVDHYYGKNSAMIDHRLLKIPDAALSRLVYTTSPLKQLVSNDEYSWNYPRGSYSMMSYNKAATWLFTLMGITGEETMNGIFREYYNRWAFKHPSGKDFIDVVNDVVVRIHGNKFGPDMNWFFDQTLYGTGICDYKVSSISNRIITESGMGGIAADTAVTKESAEDEKLIRATACIERVGEVMLPVEILIGFDDGEEITEYWDGKERYTEYEYTGDRKIAWVKIDPEYRIRMDVNFINNSMTTDPDRGPVRRITGKLMLFVQLFISMISI